MNERIAYDSKYKATPSVQDKLKPSEQEMNIVNYHRNTIKSGKVGTDEEGRPVTVYATGIKIPEGKYKGQFVSVPGYFDGKIHSEGEAYNKWKNEINEGKWPLYKSADEINRRSKELHQIMDDEEQQALKSRDKSKNTFGYNVRNLSKEEDAWFKNNPNVAGRAVFEDKSIILNPYSKLKDSEKQAVARNEGLRLWMNENKVVPNIKVTEEQLNSFKGTEYGKKENEASLKQTIISRIVSGDPSAKATEEQKKEAERILKLTEAKK